MQWLWREVLPRDVRALAPPGRAAVLLMAADRPGAGAHLGLVFDETLSDAAPGLEPSTVDAVALAPTTLVPTRTQPLS